MTTEQRERIDDLMADTERFFAEHGDKLKKFPKVLQTINELHAQVAELRRTRVAYLNGAGNGGMRWIGGVPFVSNGCAEALASTVVLECDRAQLLGRLVKDSSTQERLVGKSRGILGIETRTALTTTQIPVPTVYAPEVIELVFAYGQARQFATVFPMSAGTGKLPRLKAGEDDFGYLGVGTAGMSQDIPEKRPTAELVTFTENKAGGLIRIPYELQEDTFIAFGQFLARYAARQLAKLEDKTLFLADGTATYADQTGVATYCSENPTYQLQLDAGKTLVSDAALADFRNLRAKVSPAVLGNMAANGQTQGAYYMHPSLEPLLRSFNSYPNFIVFEMVNGRPTFDGWPVRWIGVSAANDAVAHPDTPIAFFGDLSYWYLGERGTPRIEISKDYFFNTDELAMRVLERIDCECMAVDSMATLQTAAS